MCGLKPHSILEMLGKNRVQRMVHMVQQSRLWQTIVLPCIATSNKSRSSYAEGGCTPWKMDLSVWKHQRRAHRVVAGEGEELGAVEGHTLGVGAAAEHGPQQAPGQGIYRDGGLYR